MLVADSEMEGGERTKLLDFGIAEVRFQVTDEEMPRWVARGKPAGNQREVLGEAGQAS